VKVVLAASIVQLGAGSLVSHHSSGRLCGLRNIAPCTPCKAVALQTKTLSDIKSNRKEEPVPTWSDAALIAAALLMCGAAQAQMGSVAAGWGAVTVCVLTGLETNTPFGSTALRRGLLRLIGTCAGASAACLVAFWPQWACMAAWASGMVCLKKKLPESWGYACIVSALTFAVVGLGGDNQVLLADIAKMGCQRVAGVFLGFFSLASCLAFRAGLCRQIRHGNRR